jgi:hypothetical protein
VAIVPIFFAKIMTFFEKGPDVDDPEQEPVVKASARQ